MDSFRNRGRDFDANRPHSPQYPYKTLFTILCMPPARFRLNRLSAATLIGTVAEMQLPVLLGQPTVWEVYGDLGWLSDEHAARRTGARPERSCGPKSNIADHGPEPWSAMSIYSLGQFRTVDLQYAASPCHQNESPVIRTLHQKQSARRGTTAATRTTPGPGDSET
jgi:hypothetical protein